MNLGVQYYRPPFPVQSYWEEDFKQIKASGLDTIQLWVVWAWVEPKPGQFEFGDYDRLVELAAKHGLKVVMSTIAEVHPYWIHRAAPGSEMIDHMGHKVISSNRNEIHFGITPGGCFDKPDVWQYMARFLTEVVSRYRSAPNLVGWDAWNELRWNVQADGLVCFCPDTVQAFRSWLSERYGGLDGLNAAWLRRYGCWEDVFPGKLPDRPYTEIMAWLNFLTWRSNQHGKARYDLMKALDPQRPVTVHGGQPSPLNVGTPERFFYALDRGNDWFYADDLDGIGTSSFPIWENIDDAGFGMRVEFTRSAARGKRIWLSEVQGGRSAVGFNAYKPVDAYSQQRWVWNGLACGAEKILFWAWRNEVFGRESGGFGISGDDGLAEERLTAMRTSADVIAKHAALLENYKPVQPQVGVLFSPQTYYMAWAQENIARRVANALQGYTRALVRQSIPYLVVEEEHLDVLDGLKVLFLPHVSVLSDKAEQALEAFVRRGGTLICESECGAFNPAGIYRYPVERLAARLAGITEVGRRNLSEPSFSFSLDGQSLTLGMVQWMTPWQRGRGAILADSADGALISDVPVDLGRLVLVGTYLGESYFENWTADFERFVAWACRSAGWQPDLLPVSPAADQTSFVYTKYGQSGDHRVVFVFLPANCEQATLQLAVGFFAQKQVTDILSGNSLAVNNGPDGQTITVAPALWRIAVLTGK